MKIKITLIALLAPVAAFAAGVTYSLPFGGMTISVPPGQTRSITLPLLPAVVGNGKVIGKITAVGSNYIEIAGANWTPAAFSNPANPYFVRIRTGAAAGRVIPVSTTANTATRLNLTNDGFALHQVVAPAAGDEIELVLADSLETLFGSNTLQGGANANVADNVLIWSNTAFVTYYYNTTRSRWERNTDTAASASRNTQLLRQDRGFMIVRRAGTELKMLVTGRVPEVAPVHPMLRPGYTLFSSGLPVSTTLGSLAFQALSAGWTGAAGSAAASSSADLIQIWSNTSWVSYYYDSGKQSWQRSTDAPASASRDSTQIPAGQSFMIRRVGPAGTPAASFVQLPLPYSVSL